MRTGHNRQADRAWSDRHARLLEPDRARPVSLKFKGVVDVEEEVAVPRPLRPFADLPYAEHTSIKADSACPADCAS